MAENKQNVSLKVNGRKRRIAIMTSGGDAPGMNGAVRGVVRMAIHQDCEAYAIYEGYQGLVQGGDKIRQMGWEDVRGYLSEGGTLIGTARCAEFRTREGRLAGAANLVANGIDGLIVCGGDGSLTGADTFRAEWPGLMKELVGAGRISQQDADLHQTLNIVGIVGSIDNDMAGTDTTIGAYTSLHRICEMVDLIDTTAQSHQRAFVIEVMGRHCGWLALMAGVSCGADFVFLPENPPAETWAADMCAVVEAHREKGKRKTIVIVAEGAHDRKLNKITTTMVMDILANRLKLDTRITTLGHIQRGGAACAYDRLISTIQGAEAVNAVLNASPDSPSPVISTIENKIVHQDLMKSVQATQLVAEAIGRQDFDKAMELRDSEFKEYLDAFRLTTTTSKDLLLPKEKRLRIGIIHVGAPAGGMNAATRSAVAYCLSRGHTPVGLYNGFAGICRHHDDKPIGAVREINWIDAERWASRGGSEIGTNRALPSEDIETVAYVFGKHNIQALFVIGGFEAFTAVSELRKGRKHYHSFKIPMVVLPATVSNNVPGTDYSLGSDTCLNALVQFCDACRQSASSTRRRVFVIETQGGKSGYIATIAGICVGALAAYIPEDGITLDRIRDDIALLRDVFSKDQGQSRAGKIILRNEKASNTFTTEVIANLINEGGLERTPDRQEPKQRFEARVGVPGHFQQGTTPSPMDRVRGTRFGIMSVQHLEKFAGMSPEEIADDELSAAVIGMQNAAVGFKPMDYLETYETDWKNRRPKNEWWMKMRGLIQALSGSSTSGKSVVITTEGTYEK